MEIKRRGYYRLVYVAAGILGMASIYLFQYTDFLLLITDAAFGPQYHFVLNRFVRILVNDVSMMAVIYGIFYEKKVLKLVLVVQVIDLIVLFPLYVIIKLHVEGTSEL